LVESPVDRTFEVHREVAACLGEAGPDPFETLLDPSSSDDP
jgi:hypothetical protein